jgi:hypothetical protein
MGDEVRGMRTGESIWDGRDDTGFVFAGFEVRVGEEEEDLG